jgi:hypothetical protein
MEEVMRNMHPPQTRVPSARPRVDPETLMPTHDDKGRMLWDMPAPSQYAEHKRWRRHKRTGERIAEPIMVPIYRGTSASYARYVKSQIRRSQRKAAEAQELADTFKEAEKAMQEAEMALLQTSVLNPGGYNVN